MDHTQYATRKLMAFINLKISIYCYLISMIHSNTIAILALADCRYYDFEFGYAMDKVLETMANGSTYVLNEGLELPKISFESRKILWIIQETEVLALADTFGPPYDLDPDSDL